MHDGEADAQVVQHRPGHREQAQPHDEQGGQAEPVSIPRHAGDATDASAGVNPAAGDGGCRFSAYAGPGCRS